MKKLLTFLFVLIIASFSQAQWIVQSFDNAVNPNTDVGTNWADTAIINTNFYAGNPSSLMDLSNDPDSYDGGGSMRISYNIAGSQWWIVRTNYHEAVIDSVPYIDLSTGTDLSLWYKVAVAPDTATAGAVLLEFKLAQWGNDNLRSYFRYQPATMDLFDDSGQWINITMPLVQTDDLSTGFAYQGGESDDQDLHFDKIKGFEIAIASNGSTAPVVGAVLIDKLELIGNRYNPFQTFDNAATDVFSTDVMDWAGAGASSIAFSNNTTDFVEGTGSLQMDYTVNASQDWGGYLNMTDTLFVPDSNFAERTALVFWVKNVNPFMGTTPERVTMRFFLMENSTGVNEDWVNEVPVNFEQASEWTRYYLPLKQDTVWTDSAGHQRFPQNGFAQPWWSPSPTGDNTFNLESVTGYKIELSAGGNDYGPVGETFTGTLLFDIIQQSGFQFADKTAPDPPVVSLIPSTYSNLVTWIDVPGETGEHYFVYYSEQPITDIEADGVFLAYRLEPIPHGEQVYTHAIRSANTDKDKTFYYAVTAKDLAGNISEPAFAGPITNTAQGVPTVSITPPGSFAADGDLSDWSDAQPSFLVTSVNHVLNVDDDADCSAEVKVAIDANYLYVMMDVTDDIVIWDEGQIYTYEQDAPDLYIGLYNITKSHVGYWRGETPDYHLRFGKYFVRSDEAASQCDEMIANGTENYYYGEKFPSGYIVEARIPLDTLATKRNDGITSTDVINWKVSDKIPFDIAINDNDGNDYNQPPDGVADRDGIIFYSPTNKDAGWQNVNSWTHTWISDDVTAVDENPGVAITFNLEQNYPNPFNPSTQIKYSIAEAGLVNIKVFDILGREVADLVNTQQSAGAYTVNFNAQNLATGVYIYRIESGSFQASKKMMLIK